MKNITKNVRSERGNPTTGFLNDRCKNVAIMKNHNDFFRKIVFTVVMLVWCGAMSHLSAQQICTGETYEVAVKIHYATTLEAEWVTGNEGTGTIPQPQLGEDNLTWTWLYSTTPQDEGKTIKARLFTDFTGDYCTKGDEMLFEFTVTSCKRYIVSGTVFPFVHKGIKEFDDLFETTAKLYNMPPIVVLDRLGFIRKQIPFQTILVTYYDCTVDEPIIGAPKHPGYMGNINNPGLPIKWEILGYTNQSKPNDETLTEEDNCPTSHIGKFSFENVPAGEYVLEIARRGFLSRYGVVTVTGDMYSGHREILAGDVNGDTVVNEKDISVIRTKSSTYGSDLYSPAYDFNGNGVVNSADTEIMRINLGAISTIYQETTDFVTP